MSGLLVVGVIKPWMKLCMKKINIKLIELNRCMEMTATNHFLILIPSVLQDETNKNG